jgi:hypothetical protein
MIRFVPAADYRLRCLPELLTQLLQKPATALMVGTDFGVRVVWAIGRTAIIHHALFGIGQIALAQDFSAYIADHPTVFSDTTLLIFHTANLKRLRSKRARAPGLLA